MKKLILLFITLCSLYTLNGMEEKSLDKTHQEQGTFDILPAEIADTIISTALENHIQEMDKLKTQQEFKNHFEELF